MWVCKKTERRRHMFYGDSRRLSPSGSTVKNKQKKLNGVAEALLGIARVSKLQCEHLSLSVVIQSSTEQKNDIQKSSHT